MPSLFDVNAQHLEVDSKIAAALERMSQAFRVLLWEKTKTHQLSPIQVQFLVYLLYHPASQSTISHLAKEYTLTPATVSDAITTLEEKKLVARERSMEDRRVAFVALTSAGKKMARKLASWAEVIREAIADFPAEDKPIVMKFLMRLLAALQQAGVITIARMCLTCKFFQPEAHPHARAPHHCGLLNKPLADIELRFDCPEHQTLASLA